jgi:hypothetical protein
MKEACATIWFRGLHAAHFVSCNQANITWFISSRGSILSTYWCTQPSKPRLPFAKILRSSSICQKGSYLLRGAACSVLTVFFITRSIFGLFQLFLGLNIWEESNWKNEYRHSIIGLTVWPGRSFLYFRNLISSNPFLCKFHVSRLVRSLYVFVLVADFWKYQLFKVYKLGLSCAKLRLKWAIMLRLPLNKKFI